MREGIVEIIKPVSSFYGDHKKPGNPRKKWYWILGILAVLGIAAVVIWQFKLHQPLLDRYNEGTVSIKVKEGDTFVIEGASVTLGEKSYTTDEAGKVTINAVAGSYEIIVTKEGYVEAKQSLTIHRGENEMAYVSLSKQPAKTYAVKGTIQDYVSGQALVDAQVTLGTKTVKTDPSGAYSFENVAPAVVKVKISKAGYLDKEQEVTVLDKDVLTEKVTLVPSGEVVFVSNRDGKRSLYISKYDGSDQKLYVQPSGDSEDFAPYFSPDTKTIVFSSTRDKVKGTDSSELGKLYVVSGDGTQPKKVSDNVSGSFTVIWAPDSKHFYFSGYTDPKQDKATYQVYDVSKGTVMDIGEPAYDITFSSDGSTVAYYVNGFEDRANPAYVEGGDQPSTTRAYLNIIKTLNLSSGERKTIAKREQGISEIAFTNSDKSVAYIALVEGVRRRFETVIADSTEKEVPVSAIAKRRYSVSPQGNWKAFIEERDGKRDLFIVDKDDKNEKKLTSLGSVTLSQAPVWAGSGKYLTFAVKREAESALYIVSIDAGEPKKITDYFADTYAGY
jgi:Tol biopolymer transport system component